jgi:hypothetical protein
MRNGYLFVVLFSLGFSILQTLKYQIFTARDFREATLYNLRIQIATMFILMASIGWLIVRWYYKQKEN